MKVNPNREVPSPARHFAETKSTARSNDTDKPNFVATNNLVQRLASTPDVRAEEVARAKALIADPDYPDAKTIRAIARQLAVTEHFEAKPEQMDTDTEPRD
jgi:hypothetical protein